MEEKAQLSWPCTLGMSIPGLTSHEEGVQHSQADIPSRKCFPSLTLKGLYILAKASCGREHNSQTLVTQLLTNLTESRC